MHFQSRSVAYMHVHAGLLLGDVYARTHMLHAGHMHRYWYMDRLRMIAHTLCMVGLQVSAQKQPAPRLAVAIRLVHMLLCVRARACLLARQVACMLACMHACMLACMLV